MKSSLNHVMSSVGQKQFQFNHFYQKRYTSSSGSGRKFFRWPVLTLPLGVGFAYIAYQQLGHILERNNDPMMTTVTSSEWKIAVYKSLPLRIISRWVGKLADTELPAILAPTIYSTYGRFYGVNMMEANVEDYSHYKTFSQFFRRRLKPDARPIDTSVPMVCPSDGKVLHFGVIDCTNSTLEQVKGVTYSLRHFLGDEYVREARDIKATQSNLYYLPDDEETNYAESLKHCPTNRLYHCIIYLAPGDYHLYHSPVEWTVNYRRHFHGELLSVNPYIARKVPSLFALNERAVYYGQWQYGFFSMTPVGATNVGSIRVFHDPELQTNTAKPATSAAQGLVHFNGVTTPTAAIATPTAALATPTAADLATPTAALATPTTADLATPTAALATPTAAALPPMPEFSNQFQKGTMFGEFNLGSTIVLIFEAPKDFKFKVQPGDIVKYGQPLGEIESEISKK